LINLREKLLAQRDLRQPEIGDTGTVVHIGETRSGENIYVVQCVARGGYTLWLADFTLSEIEIIHRWIPTDSPSLHSALIQAADGEIEWVKKLLAAGADPNGMPLIMAIQCSQVTIVQMMLDAGVDIDQSFSHTTPLIHAVSGTRTDIVDLLIKSGVDVNKRGTEDISPLEAARTKGRTNATVGEKASIIQALISAGAKE